MTNLIQAAPEIVCRDYWPAGIPKAKLEVYKSMIKIGIITKPTVVYNARLGSMTVEYYATAPHEWILDAMKEAAAQ